MRIGLIIAGVIIAALGVIALSGKLSVNRDKEVLKVGDLSATVQQEQTLPTWLGGVGVVVGVTLVVVGASRRR